MNASVQHAGQPRVCIYSMRELDAHVSRAGGYEFEDVVASDLDDAEILTPRHRGLSERRLSAHRWLSRRTPIAARMGSGLDVAPLDRDYDLFFFFAAQPRDLLTLGSLPDWRKRAGRAVCWLQELWVDDIATLGRLLDVLNAFDHVISPFHHSTEPLQQRLSVPVTYLPWGVDALAFCPWPDPPERVIDFYNIGGISPVTHAALVDYAENTRRFYLHDTTGGRRNAKSHVLHRRNYAGQLQRTQYFFAHMAKMSRPGERGAQIEFGLRYTEGTAAGTILLGDRIDNPAFDAHFGWEDAVFQIPYDCPDIGAFVAELERQPARLDAARRRNVSNALRRHDYAWRWQQLLDLIDLPERPQLASRRRALEERAAAVMQDGGHASEETIGHAHA
ncbi:glycosyltransferase family protein [Halovulum sp. GXIMD14794]